MILVEGSLSDFAKEKKDRPSKTDTELIKAFRKFLLFWDSMIINKSEFNNPN